MSAQALRVETLVFPYSSNAPACDHKRFCQVDKPLSFSYSTDTDLRTLSTNGAGGGSNLGGLLYIPDLDRDDPESCYNKSRPYIPTDAVRREDLPDADYSLIALAPWLSPACTLAYLNAAQRAPTQAFIFFLPENNTSDVPESNSVKWDLGDGGEWKSDNPYPVYVVPGPTGHDLVTATTQYSGDVESVPHGDELLKSYDAQDYVRLYLEIDTGGGARLPSLWVFLLVVLAILLLIIGSTSVLMHWIQRRRRMQLRQRVVTGDVDLEALGIKRLTVPQELINQMPLYIYGTLPQRTEQQPSPGMDKETSSNSRSSSPAPDVRPTPARMHSYRPAAHDQPTCPICLDDFVAPAPSEPGSSVRELPCHHIFHPECVDTFLRDNSSLCPMCKSSCLPKGYCPKNVTNAMVRRERIMRRNRERGRVNQPTANSSAEAAIEIAASDTPQPSHPPPASLGQRISRRITSAPISSTPGSDGQQMADLSTTPRRSATTAGGPSVLEAPADTSRRREWARQRAVAMLGRRAAPLDPDAEEAARTPRWRKVIGSIFPGVGGR
ncbi:hypothetical protein Q7P37_004655 [Cladosporium fusiforme]